MTVGTALAGTNELPFNYPNDANAATNNDVWIVFYGGTATPPINSDEAVRDSIKSVDVVISGKATFNAELIYNYTGGWVPLTFADQEVDGEMTLNMPCDGTGAGYAEVVVNLKDKSEGPLAVKRLDFKDADGAVVLSHGEASAAAGGEAAPKTGVVSTALFLGLGAAVLGTGAVVLKKKED
ncbi:MAG: LPXTG cell wall anchor domain-containing protein [Clostridiales bacterium]|nr:LPXTG cell wall anchor domain-containing protein [Clostridiales bacterium]